MSSFPSADENRAEWRELSHLQSDLDGRSKKFHERQYAAGGDGGGGGADAGRRHGVSPGRGTPTRTPGRSGLLGPAPGREKHDRAAPLGNAFWVELKGAVYGVDQLKTQTFVEQQQRAVLADTVVEVVEFQSSDTGGHKAMAILGRLEAARELFQTELQLTEAISRNPTTRLRDFQDKEDVLTLWYNADSQLKEFHTRCKFHLKLLTGRAKDRWKTPMAPDGTPWSMLQDGVLVQGFRPKPLLFAQRWCKRIGVLLEEYHKRASLRRTTGLPSLSGAIGEGMMLLMKLVHGLVKKEHLASQYEGEGTVDQLISLAKELLTLNCASDASKWRAYLGAVERSEYDHMLSQLFERYFDIIRSPGWNFRPQVSRDFC